MALTTASAQVRVRFLDQWLEGTLGTYPEQSGGLLRRTASPFRNPIGSTLRAALTGLTEELFGGFDRAHVTGQVDIVVRLRAVQDFTPSQVTEFVTLARRTAARMAETGRPRLAAGTFDLVSARIDALAPIADERLARCRDDLRAITERAARRRVFVLERMHARAAAGPPASRGETP